MSYGANAQANVITKRSGAKEYKIHDHLGSTRIVINADGVVTGRYDHEPFGGQIVRYQDVATTKPHKGFIDGSVHMESGDHNFEVRQYDVERFLSIDPLWEQYRALSPYVYCADNPLLSWIQAERKLNGREIPMKRNNMRSSSTMLQLIT